MRSEVMLLRGCTSTCHVRAAVPLNGGHRSVKMRLQNLLTGDLLDHELPVTFQPAYQPVFLLVVAHCKKATCSPSTVINDFFIFFFQVTKLKRSEIDIQGRGRNQ